MNARNGSSKIPLPSIIDDARWIGRFSREVRKSIAALRDRKVVSGLSTIIHPKPPPFDITLHSAGSGNYEVVVQDGWVIERSPVSGTNALAIHSPANGGERLEIEKGKQISLVVKVNQDGEIGAEEGNAVEIAITDEDIGSTHYYPKIADETAGIPGIYYYKLGVLREASETHPQPYIEKVLSGSHIDHFRELPQFKKIAGSYDIFKRYDASTGIYKTKGLSAGEGISIDDNEQRIEISVDYGEDGPYNGDITIRDCDGDPGATPPVLGTLKLRIRVVNGLIVAVNESETQQAITNEKGSTLQSCCWVDDADHSHT